MNQSKIGIKALRKKEFPFSLYSSFTCAAGKIFPVSITVSVDMREM